MQQLELDTNQSETIEDSYYHEMTTNGSLVQRNRELFKALSKYSQDKQNALWLSCVLPEQLDKKSLQQNDIDPKGILQMRPNSGLELEELILKALCSGKSHTVIALSQRLSNGQRLRIKEAAQSSRCLCVVIASY